MKNRLMNIGKYGKEERVIAEPVIDVSKNKDEQ